jgi:hypothetical protein
LLSLRVVPKDFKLAIVHPVHKGNPKPHAEPGSYRPVSILTALLKVLETVVKEDLESHLDSVGALPNMQHGFRRGRSCTRALSAAHARWSEAATKRQVIGILAFDLSAAFDTAARDQLLPKPAKVGVTGTALNLCYSYMTGGRQEVVWSGKRSSLIDVIYGVRQGSILGPLLYNVHVADMPTTLDVGKECNTGYADDTGAWQVGNNLEDVRASLQRVADCFAAYTKGNGLSLNAAKTQLMYNRKRADEYNVVLDGAVINPSSSLELLGVRYNRLLTPKHYVKSLVKAVKTRASVVIKRVLAISLRKN